MNARQITSLPACAGAITAIAAQPPSDLGEKNAGKPGAKWISG